MRLQATEHKQKLRKQVTLGALYKAVALQFNCCRWGGGAATDVWGGGGEEKGFNTNRCIWEAWLKFNLT
jgi:hypothetical protein